MVQSELKRRTVSAIIGEPTFSVDSIENEQKMSFMEDAFDWSEMSEPPLISSMTFCVARN